MTVQKLSDVSGKAPVDRAVAYRDSLAASLRQQFDDWLASCGGVAAATAVIDEPVAETSVSLTGLLEDVRTLDEQLARLAHA